MLVLDGVCAGYGGALVLRDLGFRAAAGEVTCIMGRNGVGKTTLMRAIMGLVRVQKGSVRLDRLELANLPAHEVPRHGVGYVPQGRRLFSELTVMENLRVGLMTRHSGPEVLEHVLTLFPLLRDRLNQRSGTMSGGEQQMLAMARALCISPKLLLLDEPCEGIAPLLVESIRDALLALRAEGMPMLVAEQNRILADRADRVVTLVSGRMAAA